MNMLSTIRTVADLVEAHPGSLELSPARSQFLTLICDLKATAARHIFIEITEVAGTHDTHLAELLKDVKVIVSSLDGTLKQFAKLSMGASKPLLRERNVTLVICDEAQRAELLLGMALLANTETAVILADSSQCIPNPRTYERHNPWKLKPTAASTVAPKELMNPEQTWLPNVLAVENSAALVMDLNTCKRCGDELTAFLRAVCPAFLSGFRSSPNAPRTVLTFCFYPGHTWHPMKSMPTIPVSLKQSDPLAAWSFSNSHEQIKNMTGHPRRLMACA